MTTTNQIKTCPRCGDQYEEFPALSRRDNKTDICSDCGTEEALIDAGLTDMLEETAMEREYHFCESLSAKESN